VCDVGPAGGEDRDAVVVLGLGSRVEIVPDEFCPERFRIVAVVDAPVRGVRVDGRVDVPSA